MAVNKVMDSTGNVLIDLTADTVAPDKVLQGYTFHDRSGVAQTGTVILGIQGTTHGDWVMFFDYDGTMVETWTREELQQASALPAGPDHTSENLTFDGWNYTLADLLEQEAPIVVGACFKTTDDITYIEIKISFNKNISLYVNTNTAEYTIDWGDGTTNTVTALNTNTSNNTAHTYGSTGNYTIKISSTGTYGLGQGGWTNCVVGANSSTPYIASIIKSVKLSSKVNIIQAYAFYNAYNLKKINFPSSLTRIGTSSNCNVFQESLVKTIIIPRGCNLIAHPGISKNGINRDVVSIPNTIITPTIGYVRSEKALRYFSTPKSVTTIPMYYFENNYSLAVPQILPNANQYMFQGLNNNLDILIQDWNSAVNKSSIANGSGYVYKHDITISNTSLTNTTPLAYIECSGKLTLPGSITTINSYINNMKIIDISACETVPTLGTYQCLFQNGICPDKIIIGAGMMSQYATATNWSTIYAYGLLEEATA